MSESDETYIIICIMSIFEQQFYDYAILRLPPQWNFNNTVYITFIVDFTTVVYDSKIMQIETATTVEFQHNTLHHISCWFRYCCIW